MSELVLVDNDIALKLCAYACAPELIGIGSTKLYRLTMLRVARHAIDRRIQRARSVRDAASLRTEWNILAAAVNWVEPTQEEIEFAAELEEQAIDLGLELDSGESQLAAILVYRMAPLLLTGDKRAIAALGALGNGLPTERVACLEQVVFTILRMVGSDILRQRICSEPAVDRSLSIVFSCHSVQSVLLDISIEQGLISYVASVQESAPAMLIKTPDLSAVIS